MARLKGSSKRALKEAEGNLEVVERCCMTSFVMVPSSFLKLNPSGIPLDSELHIFLSKFPNNAERGDAVVLLPTYIPFSIRVSDSRSLPSWQALCPCLSR